MTYVARVKTLLGGKGTLTTLASAATLNVPDDENAYYVSGTTTITSLTVAPHLRNRRVTFIGAASASVPFTNTTGSTTAGQMDFGGVTPTLSAGDVFVLFCNENGVWKPISLTFSNAVSQSVASATNMSIGSAADTFVVTGTTRVDTLVATDNDRYRCVVLIGGTGASVAFTNNNAADGDGEMNLRGIDRTLTQDRVMVLVQMPANYWILQSFA